MKSRQLVLNNYNIYLGTDPQVFQCAGDVELPEINWMTADVDQAGMAGKISVPLVGHSESMSVTITAPVLTMDAIAAAAGGGQTITARMAVEQMDTGSGERSFLPEVVIMRGTSKTIKLGKAKKGETMDTAITFELDYVKVVIGGAVALEHDKWNNILVVNGVDKLSAVRDAI